MWYSPNLNTEPKLLAPVLFRLTAICLIGIWTTLPLEKSGHLAGRTTHVDFHLCGDMEIGQGSTFPCLSLDH